MSEKRIEELKAEYEQLINRSNNYKALFNEAASKAIEVEKEIKLLERDSKYKTLTSGSILEFKDEDAEIVKCRIVYINEKYCDLMVEEGNEFYPSYSVMGYKCRFVDTLINLFCEDHDFELVKATDYSEIE